MQLISVFNCVIFFMFCISCKSQFSTEHIIPNCDLHSSVDSENWDSLYSNMTIGANDEVLRTYYYQSFKGIYRIITETVVNDGHKATKSVFCWEQVPIVKNDDCSHLIKTHPTSGELLCIYNTKYHVVDVSQQSFATIKQQLLKYDDWTENSGEEVKNLGFWVSFEAEGTSMFLSRASSLDNNLHGILKQISDL